MQTAQPGEVLVIDNGGRLDEGCIGDLTALEAENCGLTGIIVWGAHRRYPRAAADSSAYFQLWDVSFRPATTRPA
jgi:regulator of RNase E activity RraA